MTTLSQSEKNRNLINDTTAGAEPVPLSQAQRRLIWLLVAVTMGLTLVTLLISLYYAVSTGDARRLLSHQAMLPLTTAVFSVLGALVVSRQPNNLIGWLFLIVGLFEGLSSFAAGYSLFGSALWNREPYPGADIAIWLNLWIWMPAIFLPTTLILLLFPNGKLPSNRWRPVAWMTVLGMAAVMLSRALHPGPVESWGPEINPLTFGISPGFLEVVLNLGTLLLIVAMIASIIALIGRFRRSRGVERQQIKWLVYAGMIMVLGFVVTGILWFSFPANPLVQELSIVLTGVTVLIIGVGAGVAIARYNLYDIDLIINRTLVYVTLTAVIIVLYAVLVGGVGALMQAQSNWIVALAATVVVAILFQPLRERLQKGVNRLLYGQRDEPFEVLSDLGQRLEGTLSPDMVYPTLVETVADTLKLPYAAIAVQGEAGLRLADSYGRPVGDLIVFPLTYQGEMIGQLEVAPRRPGESLSEADMRLLRNIASQAGTAVHAVQLTSDLQRSRRQLVTAREEERRRLRRDLHDGLGPSLAALHLQSGVLRRLIKDDPQAAQALVDEFRGDIRATIEEIRRVVYELRPPALDELGLAAAVSNQAERWSGTKQKTGNGEFTAEDNSSLRVVVETEAGLPTLPAAVEVAAYRIIQEALANVAHHAQASQCVVRLSMAGQGQNSALQVEITDDGIGLNGRGQGLGLLSMRERAEELGGQLTVSSLPMGGTRVWARLPVT
jgi:signal transduction histidine kinase